MPKRSNEYQKLIKRIVEQLSVPHTKVTESKLLIDKDTGSEREVDIYVEDTAGPFPITVGIECTATNRRVDLPKMEQIHAKHQRLNIGHTVVVSKSGFSKTATKYGAKNHIQLLAFNEANDLAWPEWFSEIKKLSLRHIQLDVNHLEVTITNWSEIEFDLSYQTTVYSDKIGPVFLADFAYYLHKTSPGVVSKNGKLNTEKWTFMPEQKIVDIHGNEGTCSELVMGYSETSNEIPLNLKYGEFQGKPFAYGSASAPSSLGIVSTIVSKAEPSKSNKKSMYNVTLHIDTDNT